MSEGSLSKIVICTMDIVLTILSTTPWAEDVCIKENPNTHTSANDARH